MMKGNTMFRFFLGLYFTLVCSVLYATESISADFVFSDTDIITKNYQLENMSDGAMRLTIPVADIPRNTRQVRIYSSFFEAEKGDEGYFIIPNVRYGNIGYFKHENGRKFYDPQLAFIGSKTPKGAYVAIVKGLELEFSVIMEVKNKHHILYPRFNINKIDFDPYEDIVIDYYNLGKNATYVDMAKKYRQYKIDSGAIVSLKERVKTNPILKYSVEAPFIRVKLANNKHPKGMDGYNSPKWDKVKHELNIMNTFDDFINIMKNMHNAGVKEADMCFVGWQVGGFDGYFPDLFPVEERLGGEAKMREAVKVGKELGYHMTTHINNHNMYKRAKRWSDEFVSKNRKGEPRVYTYWPGGKAYNTCFQTICDRFIDSDIAKLKDMGMNAPQHVDVTTARRPDPCCDAIHPNNREQQAQHQIRLGKKYRKHFGGFTSEAGYDHCIEVLDYALYTSSVYAGLVDNLHTDKISLTERDLFPIWQIVYHGYVLSNPDWYTIDCYLKPKGHQWRLKFIECGGRPTFYWTQYKSQKDIDAIAEAYREYVPMRHLQYETIERHQEIAKGIILVGYSNGSEVVVNYSDKPYEYKGKVIQPRDYLLF